MLAGASMADAVTVEDHPEVHRLEAHIGSQVAYAAYEITPGKIVFTHTKVPEALRHHGIATQLVEAGISLARSRGLKIVPKCPFFTAYFAAHPELSELLAAPPQPPP
jgi:hypothetical protein